MKFGLLSDPHIIWEKPEGRLDDVEWTSFCKFESVIAHCAERGYPLLIAGDLTDRPRSWRIHNKLARLLRKYRHCKVYCVFGQHDAYMRENRDTTILGALASSGLVRILDKGIPPLLAAFSGVAVYGCSYEDKIPVPGNSKATNILVIHAPISKKKVPYDYLDAKHFLRKHKSYKLILCGDIHKKFFIHYKDRFILNTGPMMRREATKDMMRHRPCFYVYDSKECSFDKVEIAHKPFEEVLTREHLDQKQSVNKLLEDFIKLFKERVELGDGKVSKIFFKWAKKNDLPVFIRKLIYRQLMEVEDERDKGVDKPSRKTGSVRKTIRLIKKRP